MTQLTKYTPKIAVNFTQNIPYFFVKKLQKNYAKYNWKNIWITIIPLISFCLLNYIPAFKNSLEISGFLALVFSISGALFLYKVSKKFL